MKSGTLDGPITGLVILLLGVLFFASALGTWRENRRKEIDNRVNEALQRRGF